MYYEGIEQQKQRQKDLDDKWKANHPFQPNTASKRRQSSVSYQSGSVNYDKKSEHDVYVQRYLKHNFDEKTGQPLFKPVINPYKPEVVRKAYKVRYNQELEEKAKEVDKRIQSVFKFFTLGADVLRIQDLDCINLKNECIVLLKNVIVNIIKSNNHLTYNDFVDLVLRENLLPDIDRTYDFIEGRKINGNKMKKVSKRNESVSRYDSDYDRVIEKVVNEQSANPFNDEEETIKSKRVRLTNNYARLV